MKEHEIKQIYHIYAELFRKHDSLCRTPCTILPVLFPLTTQFHVLVVWCLIDEQYLADLHKKVSKLSSNIYVIKVHQKIVLRNTKLPRRRSWDNTPYQGTASGGKRRHRKLQKTNQC